MKKFTKIVLIALVVLWSVTILTGCSASEPTPSATATETAEEPVFASTSGTWMYVGDGFGFDAVVNDITIEIFLTIGEDRGLYWAGDFPDTMLDGMSIESRGDVNTMSASLFGSLDETKTFTYEDHQLLYEFTIFGVTRTIALERI